MAAVSLEHLQKTHPNGQVAVADVTLDIANGELLVLVGPSGSGKSTVLRLIAGLDTPTAGRVKLDGHDVTALAPQQRDLAMVFQNYALYPHKTARENLMFGLRMRGVPAAAMAERVQRAAAALGIETLLDRRPAELSGGEQQRVALGRAVVREPRAFLLDEPLSNLDPRLRASMRAELARLHRRLNATMIYVTHDQEEALTLGQRIAVMRLGAIEQLGAPMEVYRHPANVFVAGFIGTPAINVLPPGAFARKPGIIAAIRPHDIEVVPVDGAGDRGRVEVVEPLGSTKLLHVRLDRSEDVLLRVEVPADRAIDLDAEVAVHLRDDRMHFFDAATGIALPAD
jgi:multiple sugar transport system ATP-binding protein